MAIANLRTQAFHCRACKTHDTVVQVPPSGWRALSCIHWHWPTMLYPCLPAHNRVPTIHVLQCYKDLDLDIGILTCM